MDPVSVSVAVAFKILCRVWARSTYEEAAAEQLAARHAYEEAHERAAEEQQLCRLACYALAENRKAVLDGRWAQLHTFLVASGVNGGLFAPPRRVFGEQSEQDVRSVLVAAERLVVDRTEASMRAVNALTNSILLVQGVRCLDAAGVVHIPELHQSLHNALGSLGGDTGAGIADSLGGLGDVPVDTVLGDALDVLSFAISGYIFGQASECADNAARLWRAAQELDDKRALLAAANERIRLLMGELDATGYELLQWTVVCEEAVELQRTQCARRRNVSCLPRWMLHCLLCKATQLWASCNEPVFS